MRTPLNNKMSEADAVAGAQAGDMKCFEALYNRYKRRVYSLCLQLVRNPADAEELTQEAFLQVYRKIRTFRGEAAFSTWLHRVATNMVFMRLRKKHVQEVELQPALEDDGEQWKDTSHILMEDCQLSGSIDRLSLQQALGTLAEGYRIVFVLHDIEGLEHHEIAELLGCSPGTCKSQLHKARVKLRRFLSAHGGREFCARAVGCGEGTRVRQAQAADLSSLRAQPALP